MEATEFINKHKNKVLNLAIILLAFFIASKIYNKQLKEIDALKTKKDLESKRSDVLESISKTEKKINTYKNLLTKKELSDVINTVSNFAKESNVKIISIKPAVQQKNPEYVKIPFSLVITTSNFNALGNFISKIESYQDVYMVESIDIRQQNQPKQLNINLTLSSITYK